MLIDTNIFLGSWPFLPHPVRTTAELVAHLRKHGIGRAFVSHLGGVFQPEPMCANRELFKNVRGIRALIPAPIINPALATWRDHLEECRASASLRVVRILPSYHNYTLRDRRVAPFMDAIADAGVKLAVSARLEDERNRYFGLTVKGLRTADLAFFLRRFRHHHVLCNGLYRGEIEALARKCDNFSADFTLAEFLTTLESLRAALPARRLVVGTGTPLLSTHAQTAKLRHAHLPAWERSLIGAGNVRRLFSL
jgi:predicted TIM-barrel fold metal-dependent hydrolase